MRLTMRKRDSSCRSVIIQKPTTALYTLALCSESLPVSQLLFALWILAHTVDSSWFVASSLLFHLYNVYHVDMTSWTLNERGFIKLDGLCLFGFERDARLLPHVTDVRAHAPHIIIPAHMLYRWCNVKRFSPCNDMLYFVGIELTDKSFVYLRFHIGR